MVGIFNGYGDNQPHFDKDVEIMMQLRKKELHTFC